MTLVGAAVLIARVADGAVLKLARLGIATGAALAFFVIAAVAVFPGLNDAIAALPSRDGIHVPVIHQAVAVDATLEVGTDLTDAAGRESLDVVPRGWIHDVLAPGVALVLT